jgi:hypothetical protein
LKQVTRILLLWKRLGQQAGPVGEDERLARAGDAPDDPVSLAQPLGERLLAPVEHLEVVLGGGRRERQLGRPDDGVGVDHGTVCLLRLVGERVAQGAAEEAHKKPAEGLGIGERRFELIPEQAPVEVHDASEVLPTALRP